MNNFILPGSLCMKYDPTLMLLCNFAKLSYCKISIGLQHLLCLGWIAVLYCTVHFIARSLFLSVMKSTIFQMFWRSSFSLPYLWWHSPLVSILSQRYIYLKVRNVIIKKTFFWFCRVPQKEASLKLPVIFTLGIIIVPISLYFSTKVFLFEGKK